MPSAINESMMKIAQFMASNKTKQSALSPSNTSTMSRMS